MANLVTTKIHPAIGVARIGNHPTDYFIGPEKPNELIQESDIGGFKMADGEILKIKRQAARFRVFGYYDDGSVLELDNSNFEVEWSVRIANKKAFSNKFSEAGTVNANLRNGFVRESDRNGLILSPKELTIKGLNQSKEFERTKIIFKDTQNTFESGDIALGELKTDDKGRLIVLAGFGNTGSAKANNPIRSYVDNDYWYDDTADGYVKAKIKNKDTGEEFSAADAWVIFASPQYVPHINPIVSLYETLFSRFVIEGQIEEIERPLFYRDIYPILKKAINVKWLHKMDAHKGATAMALTNPNIPSNVRSRIFDKIRKPDGTGGNMPKLYGDKYSSSQQSDRLRLTTPQYNILKKWVNGDFDIDTPENSLPPNEITASGLDKAMLEHCVGGAFYPGIETSWFIRDKFEFIEPFRLDASKIEPGDLTKQNALPWQADFFACSKDPDSLTPEPNDFVGWWPYSRPDEVFPENDENNYHPWTPTEQFSKYEDMVDKWQYLGIVVERNGKYIEVQRDFPSSIV